MLLTATPSEALQWIQTPRQIFKERVVPAEFPHSPDSPYQPEYDWLFIYERRIAAFLETWLKPFRYELIGEKGILCEALSNAFCHGHDKDPDKPIVVRVVLGDRGLIIQVKDTGSGFDAPTVYRRFRNQKKYYWTAGNGIRHMAVSPHFGVMHDPTGTVCLILHLFGNGMTQLVPTQKIIEVPG